MSNRLDIDYPLKCAPISPAVCRSLHVEIHECVSIIQSPFFYWLTRFLQDMDMGRDIQCANGPTEPDPNESRWMYKSLAVLGATSHMLVVPSPNARNA